MLRKDSGRGAAEAPGGSSQRLTSRWSPEPSEFAVHYTPHFKNKQLWVRVRGRPSFARQGLVLADPANSATALSPKWEYWFCVQDSFQVCHWGLQKTSGTDAICLNVDMPVDVNLFFFSSFPLPLDSVTVNI